MCINSPMILPNAAPILNTGMKLPLGTGIVEHIIEARNWKNSKQISTSSTINQYDGKGGILLMFL